jgi:hypothetical protein
VLCHLAPPQVDDIEEAMPRRPIPDPFSQRERLKQRRFTGLIRL